MKKSWPKGWVRRRPPPLAPERPRIRIITAQPRFSHDYLAATVRRRSDRLMTGAV